MVSHIAPSNQQMAGSASAQPSTGDPEKDKKIRNLRKVNKQVVVILDQIESYVFPYLLFYFA